MSNSPGGGYCCRHSQWDSEAGAAELAETHRLILSQRALTNEKAVRPSADPFAPMPLHSGPHPTSTPRTFSRRRHCYT